MWHVPGLTLTPTPSFGDDALGGSNGTTFWREWFHDWVQLCRGGLSWLSGCESRGDSTGVDQHNWDLLGKMLWIEGTQFLKADLWILAKIMLMFRLARDNLGRRPSDWKGQQDSVPRKFALHLRSTVGLSEDLGKKNPSDYQMLDLCWSSFSLFPAVPGWGTGRRWGSDGRGHSRCQCRRLADAGVLSILVLGSCLNPDRTVVYPCITYVTGFIWVVWLPT